jgi:hypothetical protein
MFPLEVSRIIEGSLNRSKNRTAYLLYPNYNIIKNADEPLVAAFVPSALKNEDADLAEKGIIPYNAISPINGQMNAPIQDKYLWPWSHAALLFSLIVRFKISFYC